MWSRLWWYYGIAINVVTFVTYGLDKYRARYGSPWRIPEAHLHLLSLVGGTLGAYCGQKVFRHKTRKAEFQQVFGFIVACQMITCLVYYFWRW